MLKVNKNHKEGSFLKNKKKYFLKIGSLMLAVSIFSGVLSNNIQNYINSEEVISLSRDVVETMYFNGEYDRLNKKLEDLQLTDKAVSNVKELSIDMKENKDLSFLCHFDSIERIELKNIKFLTKNDIGYLKQCNATNIEVSMNANAKEKNIVLELAKLLNDKNISLHIDTNLYRGEIGEYIVYDIAKEMPSNVLIMGQTINQEKYKKIDKKVLEFIKTIDFSEVKKEEEVLYKLIERITEFISYDNEINNIFYDSTSKLEYYNEKLLSSVLSSISTNENSGICCNYAALLCVSAYKMGLESYFILGYVGKEQAPHAWNLVNVDNQYKYIDLTYADVSEQVDYYGEAGIEEIYRLMLEEGIDLDNYLSIYNYEYNVENDEKNELVYYNVEREGEKIETEKPDKSLSTIIGVGTGGVVAVIYDLIMKKKKQKEEQETKRR